MYFGMGCATICNAMLVFTQGFYLVVGIREAKGTGLACLREKRLIGIYITKWNLAFVARLSPVADVDEAPCPIRIFPARIATVVADQPCILPAVFFHVKVV